MFAPKKSQALSFGWVAIQSDPFGEGTKIIQVFPSKDCFIALGDNPTAEPGASDSFYLPGGVLQHFVVGGKPRLSVVRADVDGVLYIIEMASL